LAIVVQQVAVQSLPTQHLQQQLFYQEIIEAILQPLQEALVELVDILPILQIIMKENNKKLE